MKLIKKIVIVPYLKTIQFHCNRMRLFRQYYYEKEFGDWFDENFSHIELPDTLIGDCQEFVDIKGTRISVNYITHLVRIFNFSKYIDLTKIRTVFEIGGGYGATTHLLLHLYPNIKKCLYLDIPPILYVGTQYLEYFYPTQVTNYLVTRNLEEILFSQNDEREILAICPWQIEKISESFDLIWNSASFQEMEPDVIHNYVNHIAQFTANKPQSFLCLVIYTTGDLKKTKSAEEVTAMFSNDFKIEKIAPLKERDNPPDYFIGKRK